MRQFLWRRTGRIKYDVFAGRVLALFIMLYILNVAASLFIDGMMGNAMTIVIGVIFWLYLLAHFHYMILGITKAAILFVIAMFVFIITILFGASRNSEIYTRFLWFFAFSVPLFGIMARATDSRIILKESEICIGFSSAIAVLTIIMSAGKGIKGDYSMALGYALLYPSLLLLWRIRCNWKLSDIILLAINAFVIVSYGSRGQILCIGIFLLVNTFIGGNRVTTKKILLVLALMSVMLLLFVYLEEVLKYVIQKLDDLGISSRSLGYFLEKQGYTGREIVWNAALQRIQEKPLTGWGLGVDISKDGFYPHQLFLEFMLHFGCAIGGVASIYVILKVIQNVIICREHDVLTLMLCCYGVVPLMLTSEYLVWPSFWAFMGLCIGRKRRIKGAPSV